MRAILCNFYPDYTFSLELSLILKYSRNLNLQAGSSSLTPAEAAAALLRGEGKKLQRKDRKAEIARIRAELGLADAARTPAVRPLLIRISVSSKSCGAIFCDLCVHVNHIFRM